MEQETSVTVPSRPSPESSPRTAFEASQAWHRDIAANDLDVAERHLVTALDRWPQNATLVRHLSETRRRKGLVAEALILALKAIALAPSDPETHNHLAGLHLQYGNLHAATAAAQTALQLQPAHLASMLRMSDLSLRKGDVQAAHHWADVSLQAHPRATTGYLFRANVHLALGELDFAATALGEAKRLSPHHPIVKQRLDYLAAVRATPT